MTDPCVHITEFTDPACPWACSTEPFRHRLDWLYGDWLGLGRIATQSYVGADGSWELDGRR